MSVFETRSFRLVDRQCHYLVFLTDFLISKYIVYYVFALHDNETDTDTDRMACIEMCGSVHTDRDRYQPRLSVSSVPILSVSVCVCIGHRQCKYTITG